MQSYKKAAAVTPAFQVFYSFLQSAHTTLQLGETDNKPHTNPDLVFLQAQGFS